MRPHDHSTRSREAAAFELITFQTATAAVLSVASGVFSVATAS
jgi:hypothetical protein